ncbi:hypothetical protein [Azohydromonas aeria]|uniref:hypothetical protein n=1 Tax=Azohydromonas aeria TaxID=2590212 RepID=UPI0012FBB05B|nr:hypothetical protein [Azohydromonas aeria]
MNDVHDRLDGIQRWFYGGEPGMDDLPLDDDPVAAPVEEQPPAAGVCSAHALRQH